MHHIRLLLNSGFSGPHAWFFLARERGYFRDAGLDVEFIPGDGAAAVVPLVGHGDIDAGYGDMNALAEVAAACGSAPPAIAVFSVFNRNPFTIAVAADGPIHQAGDLAGASLSGHAQDAALKVFPAFADAAGILQQNVAIVPSSLSLGAQVHDLLLAGRTDGVFGFVNTILAAIAPMEIDPARLRFVEFADTVPDLYSNSLMVSRDWMVRSPDEVRALVHAVNRGLVETLQDVEAGMDALMRAAPGIRRDVQERRLRGTLRAEMADPEGGRLGIGDVDDARLQRGIDRLARACNWARVPQAGEVFTRQFLPPLQERARSMLT